MELKKRSIWARTYKWFWASELPDNLCVYFWGLLTAVVFLPITLALSLPFMLFNGKYKDHNKFLESLFGIFYWFGLFILSSTIFPILALIKGNFLEAFNHNEPNFYRVMVNMGVAIWSAIILFLIVIIPVQAYKKTNNIIAIEYVKAKLGGYCPKINWK